MKNGIDVTDALLEYREAKKSLWNNHFLRNVLARDSQVLDCFEEIDFLLFVGLVLAPAHRTVFQNYVFRTDALPYLIITSESGKTTKLIARKPGSESIWQDQSPVEVGEFRMQFIEWFDWDRYGEVSFPFVRGRLTEISESGIQVGQECLVPAEAMVAQIVD
jgi:hypothetical protein